MPRWPCRISPPRDIWERGVVMISACRFTTTYESTFSGISSLRDILHSQKPISGKMFWLAELKQTWRLAPPYAKQLLAVASIFLQIRIFKNAAKNTQHITRNAHQNAKSKHQFAVYWFFFAKTHIQKCSKKYSSLNTQRTPKCKVKISFWNWLANNKLQAGHAL